VLRRCLGGGRGLRKRLLVELLVVGGGEALGSRLVKGKMWMEASKLHLSMQLNLTLGL